MWPLVCHSLNLITSLCIFMKSICSSVFLNGLLSPHLFHDLCISILNCPSSLGLLTHLNQLIYRDLYRCKTFKLKTCTHVVYWKNLYSFPGRPDLALCFLDNRWGFYPGIHLNKSTVIRRIWLKKLHKLEQAAVIWKEQTLLFFEIASSWLAARHAYIRTYG